jgi:signal transduction histidine kinase
MGSRGRSIRLRIYFLVAIPLITMLGLFSYVAYGSITNFLNLDRAPSLIRATSEPLTNFVSLLQAERRAAVVYLSHPDAANLGAYQNAITATKNGELPLEAALNSAGTKGSTTAQETAAIGKMTSDIAGMTTLRNGVSAARLQPLAALIAYTNIIADQDTVFEAEANSITDASADTQGLGLISAVNAREDVSEQDAVLAGALASGSLTGADRVAFSQAAGRQQDDTLLFSRLLSADELNTYNSVMSAQAPKTLQNYLTEVQQAVASGVSLRDMTAKGLSSSTWQVLTGTWQKANYNAATDAANDVLNVDQGLAVSAKQRVWETAAIGAAGLIITLIVTILLARSINRRLTRLRRSALTLAEEQLPAVVARLRRGESVDVAAEAPPLRAGGDEIGQVGQAIDAVRQTAIRAAVDEAQLRQGVNDVFRNLARRNQSLLQRQLTVLDSMERRATDPDVLEDLFKMDHLTTRMRRHAEGLIILSGAAPGRGWSAPVKLVDVMRGAVAEIEDYARVVVSTQSKAALGGSAVTDVIHLLAELIENATTLSPPFTQVRVAGESVANGFAIEIEDRGLGMTPQRMAELNERLANPPDINPANTEQLGLFVVGQLARRHGISVTLRPSPYGGVTAVTLIPERLIVQEGPAAITSGGAPAALMADAQAGMNNAPGGPSRTPYGATGQTGSYGPPGGYAGSGAGYGGNGGGYSANGGEYAGTSGEYAGTSGGYPGSGGYAGTGREYSGNAAGYPGSGGGYAGSGGGYAGNGAGYPDGGGYGRGGQYGGDGGYAGNGEFGDAAYPEPPVPAPSPTAPRVSGPVRQAAAQVSGEDGGAAPGARRGRHGTSDVPVVTGVPVTRPTASSFDVFTPLHRPGEDLAAPEGRGDDVPYGQSYADTGGGSYGAVSQGGEGYGAGDSASYGDGGGYGDGGSEDYKGLPRRVRQANLAPQLRSSATAASDGPTGVPRATSASLSDMRNTLSAMQRGWQQGRSQSQGDTEGSADGD